MYIFIVNPISGHGRAQRIYMNIMANSKYNHLKFVTFHTKHIGHAEEITRHIVKEYDVAEITSLIVLGGDGTLHEVLNGLDDKAVPVSFIPGGSGNDFARGLNITRNPTKAMQQIYPNPKQLDYWMGVYRVYGNKNTQSRNFVNTIGFGFDAITAKSANQSKVKKMLNKFKLGTVNYVFAVLKEIMFYKPVVLTVEMDGMKKRFSRCFLITVNNHPYIGGGMKINPQAKNEQKYFSILVIDSISKWKVLFLLGTVFTGQHTRFKEVQIFKASKINISSDRNIPYQVDGETGYTTHCEVEKENKPVMIKGGS